MSLLDDPYEMTPFSFILVMHGKDGYAEPWKTIEGGEPAHFGDYEAAIFTRDMLLAQVPEGDTIDVVPMSPPSIDLH